jgi:hypothetical protein
MSGNKKAGTKAGKEEEMRIYHQNFKISEHFPVKFDEE